MNISSLYADFGMSCIEVFKLNLAYFTAINRVSEVRSEVLDIKLISASADFFVRSEPDLDCAVF